MLAALKPTLAGTPKRTLAGVLAGTLAGIQTPLALHWPFHLSCFIVFGLVFGLYEIMHLNV